MRMDHHRSIDLWQSRRSTMSHFDPLSSRVPLYLRPNRKTEGEHLVDAIRGIARMMRLRMLPYLWRGFRLASRLVRYSRQ